MSKYKNLILLHSNDMHGDFFAEHLDDQLVGGVSMLSGYVDHVRNTEKNVLYCIAGDMFRGSVIDSEYKGISTIEIMNAISPDVVTLGNHEIDYGIAHLLFLEKCARFPIINANLYVKTNHARLFKSHLIKEIDGMKILFIGIITENVLRAAKSEEFVGTIIDVNEAAQEVGKIANAYRSTDIDLTVLLTHIGFEQDKELAEKLDPAWGVDLIIGGHSHTFLEQAAVVNDIVIVQAGTGTDLIGRFDLILDTDNNCIDSFKWCCIPIDEMNCMKDDSIEQLILSYKMHTDKKYNRVLTRFYRQYTQFSRIGQSELGSLFTDILASKKSLDIMFLASGSIRSSKLGPLVQYGDLMSAFPYDGPIYLMKIKGSVLRQMIQYMLRDDVIYGRCSGYFQVSEKLCVEYDAFHHCFLKFEINEKPVQDEQIYRIGLLKYHYLSFEQFFGSYKQEIEELYPSSIIASSAKDILVEALSSFQKKDVSSEGRITLINKSQY